MSSNNSVVLTGRVKWFNNKSGFGFITVTDGEKSGTDVFVHHSAISVHSEQYRFLVQGEYVEFSLSEANGDHEFQASGVKGIKGGKLMCETRNENRSQRNTNVKDKEVKEKEQQLERTNEWKKVEKRKPKQPERPRQNGSSNKKQKEA